MNVIQSIGSIITAIFVGVLSIGQTIFVVPKSQLPKNPIQVEQPQIIEKPSPAPAYIPPTVVQPTAKPTVYVDPDPPVHCRMSAECGGGTTPLKQSECANSTCCGFPGGKWVFYKDKGQCLKDQGGTIGQNIPPTVNTQNNNKVPVFLSYSGITLTNCPAANVSAINSINASMESKKQGWLNDNNNCTSRFFETDSCYVACKTLPYGDNYSKIYGDCIAKCPSSYDACKWTDFERDRLSSQILDLCK